MKSSERLRVSRSIFVISAALVGVALIPFLSQARTATSVNIVNQTSREIRNLYWSHVDADDWSNDLLSSAIAAGQSYQLNDVACDGQQIKLIAEDADGCFVTTVIACGQSSNWTINNDSARDCGGSSP